MLKGHDFGKNLIQNITNVQRPQKSNFFRIFSKLLNYLILGFDFVLHENDGVGILRNFIKKRESKNTSEKATKLESDFTNKLQGNKVNIINYFTKF